MFLALIDLRTHMGMVLSIDSLELRESKTERLLGNPTCLMLTHSDILLLLQVELLETLGLKDSCTPGLFVALSD